MSAATSGPRIDDRRIARTTCVRSASLEPEQRNKLLDQLYDVYCEAAYGITRQEFEGLFGNDDTVALFYGVRDELAGFSYAGVYRSERGGRKQAIFSAGVHFRLGYHGGSAAVLFGLRQALRRKLRAPRIRLAYMTRSSSPAVYRLLASTAPRMYPSARRQTPADVEALVHEMSVRRHYVPVGDTPWIVRSAAVPHEPSRLHRLKDDPRVQFYLRMNPRFAEGEALIVLVPLDMPNIVGGLVRVLRARLASSFHHRGVVRPTAEGDGWPGSPFVTAEVVARNPPISPSAVA